MHTSTYNGTAFVYNSDYSGPIVIVSNGHSVETNIEALEQFINDKKNKDYQEFTCAHLDLRDKYKFT
jgi:hypothetical protein